MLGRKVKIKKFIETVGKEIKFLVIAHGGRELVLHSKKWDGHHAKASRSKKFLKGFETPEKRGKHCMYAAIGDVELIEDFKYVFNNLGDMNVR